MTIRLVQEKDFLGWLHMRQRLWPDCSIEDHQEEMHEWLSDLHHFPVFVAEAENRLIAFIEASIHEVDPGNAASQVAYIEGWYVEPSKRRKGIGRKLIEHTEQWARSKMFREMLSDTEIQNTESILAYHELGFKEHGRTTQEVLFKKALA